MASHRSGPTALETFIARKNKIDGMLQRLSTLSGDHFGAGPEDVNWGHVGTLTSYAELLKRITDAAFHEGDHAVR